MSSYKHININVCISVIVFTLFKRILELSYHSKDSVSFYYRKFLIFDHFHRKNNHFTCFDLVETFEGRRNKMSWT